MHQRRQKPQTARELLSILDAAQDDLGKGSRRLANFFIANLGETALLSSSEVAQRCGVNASSVVRLAQSLGFSGYREFQAVLQQHLSASIEEAKRLDALALSGRVRTRNQPGWLRIADRPVEIDLIVATADLRQAKP